MKFLSILILIVSVVWAQYESESEFVSSGVLEDRFQDDIDMYGPIESFVETVENSEADMVFSNPSPKVVSVPRKSASSKVTISSVNSNYGASVAAAPVKISSPYSAPKPAPIPVTSVPSYPTARPAPLPITVPPSYSTAKPAPLPVTSAPSYPTARPAPLPVTVPPTYTTAKPAPLPVTSVPSYSTARPIPIPVTQSAYGKPAQISKVIRRNQVRPVQRNSKKISQKAKPQRQQVRVQVKQMPMGYPY